MCSVAGITAQVNTLHLGLWGDCPPRARHRQIFLSFYLCRWRCQCLLSCYPVPFFHISHNSSKTTLSAPPLSYVSLVHRPAARTLQLSAQYNCNLSDFVDPLEAAIQSIKNICSILLCLTFVWLSYALLCVSVALSLSFRVTTGSCLPPSWRWRRWAPRTKESTPAWPSIPPWSRSAGGAPSASPCCPVRRTL